MTRRLPPHVTRRRASEWGRGSKPPRAGTTERVCCICRNPVPFVNGTCSACQDRLRTAFNLIVARLATQHGLTREQLLRRGTRGKAAECRAEIVVELREQYDASWNEIGVLLDLTHSSVIYLYHRGTGNLIPATASQSMPT